MPVGITASSDNPSLVTAAYSGSDMPDEKELVFNVKQLASAQVNVGEYVSSGAKILFPGTYSFNIETAGNTYSLEFAVSEDDNNGRILDKLANSISHSGIGLDAEVIQNEYAQKALKITSQTTGSHKGSPTQFRITEGTGNHLTGAVKLYGLDNIDSYPSNAVFDLNGKSSISENNSFIVDGRYEVTLHGTSDEYGTGTISARKDGAPSLMSTTVLQIIITVFLSLQTARTLMNCVCSAQLWHPQSSRYKSTLENNGFSIKDEHTLLCDNR